MKSLQEKVQELSKKLSIMHGKEKGENLEIVDKIVTMNDYEFINDEGKEYLVYTVKEIPETFFFGGVVLTEDIRVLDNEGYKSLIQKEGLPMKLTARKSKKGRAYFFAQFYPDQHS